ncbi:MAG: MBL fold metallo-hydrolase [Burkholderiales bacterium]
MTIPNPVIRILPQIKVVVRDWLNANHVLISGKNQNVVIDSGYGRDARRTAALLQTPETLGKNRLDWLVNTHCHSDHMGGNALLRRETGCRLSIPVGEARAIKAWDERALWLNWADQRCERFEFDDLICPGDTLDWGGLVWQAVAAPGHDMHALVFYCADERILVSGDALWENGFGVVLPGEGRDQRLAATRGTLDAIAKLGARTVIPGHGTPFTELEPALERAYRRLEALAADELRMARSALKVMFVFSLLDRGRIASAGLEAYLSSIPVYAEYAERFFGADFGRLGETITAELQQAGAIRREGGWFVAA